MRLLAIDTSTVSLSVAVIDDEKVLGEGIWNNSSRTHSIRLVPYLADLLRKVDVDVNDLEGVVVTAGPGSYTGIRIGVTVAKSLAWGLNIPLLSISSLKALAENIRCYDGLIVPLLDARRERVYVGIYERSGNELITVREESVTEINDLLTQIRSSNRKTLFLGDGFRFKKQIEDHLSKFAYFGEYGENIIRASVIAKLGRLKLVRGAIESKYFSPNYLQLTEAEKKMR